MMIRTVDTDVVVIAVAKFLQIGLEELLVAFGTGKNYRHIEVHQIVSRIGAEKSQALALFHAFTDCDTVSFFSNRGKKSAWQAWQAYPEATDVFHALCSTPPDVPETVIETLERFVVLMYDPTSELPRCSKVLSFLQEVWGDRKHSSNSSSSIATHEESRIPSRPHLGSVPGPQAICSLTR